VILSTAESLMFQKAADFFISYGISKGQDFDSIYNRIEHAHLELDQDGSYTLTSEELVYGIRIAWREYTKLNPISQSDAIDVIDCRHISKPDEYFEKICDYLEGIVLDGNIVPLITVFPIQELNFNSLSDILNSKKPLFRLYNRQLVQYAGFRRDDGGVTGDSENIDFTDFCQCLGWTPQSESVLQILPLVIETVDNKFHWYQLPCDSTKLVKFRQNTSNDAKQYKQNSLYPLPETTLEIGGLLFSVSVVII
jgi:nitric-oxide synthase, bacterial